MEKRLARISKAELGNLADTSRFGLILDFESSGWGVGCGGKYTVNLYSKCKWTAAERAEAIVKMVEHVNAILVDAKVDRVSQLKGKPVEITFDGNVFQDFRILTEVL